MTTSEGRSVVAMSRADYRTEINSRDGGIVARDAYQRSAEASRSLRARLTPRAPCVLGYTYSAIGGHAHIRLRSPYGLSIRPTLGQCLCARTNGSGNAACSRE